LNHVCLLPSRVTSLGQWPGWAGLVESNPAHAGWAGLSPQKKEEKRSRPGLGFRPSRPKVCLLRVCLAKHTLMPWP
jgi:hypothetical protein